MTFPLPSVAATSRLTVPRAAALAVLAFLSCAPIAVMAAEPSSLRFHSVRAADGVMLNVVETGPAAGTPVLFLHGVGQSWLSWRQQLEGPLAGRLRLVAMDLRGHGDSAKPADPVAYREVCRWADDVRAVQQALGLERPVLVAWSFGGLVAMHYLRCEGAGGLRGLVLVATAAGRLVTPPTAAPTAGAQRAAAAARAMVDPDLRRNLQGARDFAVLMTATPPDPAWYDETVAALLRLPAYVRRGLTGDLVGRDGKPISSNADLADAIKLPLMVVTGGRDALSDGAALAEAYRSRYPAARVQVYADSGHSPFAEESQRFDTDLAAFISSISDPPRDGG